MKKSLLAFAVFFSILILAFPIGCRNNADVSGDIDNAPTSEAEQLFEELKELVDQYDRVMPLSWAGDMDSDADMTEVCRKIAEIAPRYFTLAEPDRSAERQAVLNHYDQMPRTVVPYVHAKVLADKMDALWKEFEELKADTDPSHEEENQKKMLDLKVQFFGYGIFLYRDQNTAGDRSLSPEFVELFQDNDGFMEVMAREGFSVMKTGTGILASGVDGKGFEWRVVGDSPDAALNKMALVVRNEDGLWEVRQLSDIRDECGEGLTLCLTESADYDPYYGPIDVNSAILSGGKRHNVHFFYQSNRAVKSIDTELFASLMPRNTSVQIWQKDNSFVIHLTYSGSYGIADELSQLSSDSLYYILKGLGVVR